MNSDDDAYTKPSEYNLASQRHNHRVFIDHLRQKPWKAIALAFLFDILSIVILFVSRDHLGGNGYRSWLLAALSFLVGVYFLFVTLAVHKAK